MGDDDKLGDHFKVAELTMDKLSDEQKQEVDQAVERYKLLA
jgi:hypothetical protein